MTLDELRKLAEKAGGDESAHLEFLDHRDPDRCPGCIAVKANVEFENAMTPDFVLKLIAAIEAADAMQLTTDGNSYDVAERVYVRARAALESTP